MTTEVNKKEVDCIVFVGVLGPVVQSWVGANPGLKFNPLF